MSWQPIETAPKDGTRVLVYIEDSAHSTIAFARPWFYDDGSFGGGLEGFCGEWNVTHWHPLPEPPK